MKIMKKLKEIDKNTRHNKWIRPNDKVIVISGNEKSMTGTVLSRTETHAIVQGLNKRKKHVKKSERNPNGEILNIEAPIHLSNLKHCDAEDKPIKVRTRTQDNKKELFYRKDGQEIVYAKIKQKKS